VLSSGVAGTMAANGSGVQMSTVRSLLLAWVLTLPCAIALSDKGVGLRLVRCLHEDRKHQSSLLVSLTVVSCAEPLHMEIDVSFEAAGETG
jgi:hypothetical protein